MRPHLLAVTAVLGLALAGCSAPAAPAPAAPAPTGAVRTAVNTAPTPGATTPGTTGTTATAGSNGGSAATTTAAQSGGPAALEPDGSPAIARLALDNLGKSAGTCAKKPMKNSLGGTDFEHSCDGWNSAPEYWCADFVIWTWRHSGYDVTGLDAASISFRNYGIKRGSVRETPKPGDAVVFNKTMSTTTASHVAVVTSVRSDGSVVLANGDWGGQKGSEVTFATTASVLETVVPAELARVGAGPIKAQGGLQVTAIVAPVKASAGPKASGTAKPNPTGSAKASAKATTAR